jgi:hypothetical protein
MASKQAPPISFRPGDLAGAVDARGDNRNETAARDLERYYRLLEIEESALDFTPAEWMLLRDVIGNGHVGENRSAASIGMSIGDAITLDGRGEDIETGAFLHTLFSLTPAQAMALCDAVERWWIRQERRTDD